MFDPFGENELAESDLQAAEPPEAGNALPPRENPDSLGHEKVEDLLRQLTEQDRLPHALIFAGRQGTGKATMAYRLARTLLNSPSPPRGEGRGEGEGQSALFDLPPEPTTPHPNPLPGGERGLYVPPGTPTFRQVASGGHPDLMVVERPMDERKGRQRDNVDIDSVRKIAPFMRMTASHDGGWRVAIIDDADTMNRAAQNAILKILEEPPPRAVLILIAHRPGLLIPTIRSRSRVISFAPLDQAVFAALLRKGGAHLDDDTAGTLYSLTSGSVGMAGELLEEGGLETLSKLTVLLAAWPSWDWPAIHALADNLGRMGQEDNYRIAEMLLRWIIESLVRARASVSALPGLLDPLQPLAQSRDLQQWIETEQALNAHLDKIRYANLDRRQGIIGAFTVLAS